MINLSKHWILVYVAVIFEVSWVAGLKYAQHPLTWTGTVLSILISFYLLIRATNFLPISTVYAVFTGLGAAGSVFVESIFFDAPFSLLKISLCGVLITGVIGLKFSTDEDKSAQKEARK